MATPKLDASRTGQEPRNAQHKHILNMPLVLSISTATQRINIDLTGVTNKHSYPRVIFHQLRVGTGLASRGKRAAGIRGLYCGITDCIVFSMMGSKTRSIKMRL